MQTTLIRKTTGRIAVAQLIAAAFLISSASSAPDEIKKKDTAPKVQVALLLDTSSSMDGLINQARSQLWKIVNSFEKIKRDGQIPNVEVALYEYGNDGLNVRQHYIRKISGLTRDLDKVSEKLFSLKTNGGSEFCGAVIQQSLAELKWDSSPTVYKAIFIAGNEPFTQGPIEPTKVCKNAIERGIIVNTIHCGNEVTGINGGWKNGALIAEGDYLTIDQDKAVVHIEAPQDKIIIEISHKLNSTYVPYGQAGPKSSRRQRELDDACEEFKKEGASLQRAVTKGNKNYMNRTWDLVDAWGDDPNILSKIPKKDMPKDLVGMETKKEKLAWLSKKKKDRVALQKQIQKLNAEREIYVRNKLSESEETNPAKSLDAALIKSIHKQSKKYGFESEE